MGNGSEGVWVGAFKEQPEHAGGGYVARIIDLYPDSRVVVFESWEVLFQELIDAIRLLPRFVASRLWVSYGD